MRPATVQRFIFFTGHKNNATIEFFFKRVNATVLIKPFNLTALGINVRFHAVPRSTKKPLGEMGVLFASQNAPLTPS
jgi:hypothetical protein